MVVMLAVLIVMGLVVVVVLSARACAVMRYNVHVGIGPVLDQGQGEVVHMVEVPGHSCVLDHVE